PWGRDPGRRGHRNGFYRRQLVTTWGTIPDLEIPRARTPGFVPSVLPRYQRRSADVDRLIRAVFLAGVSTRRVGPTLAALLDDTVSASTVSAITRSLDQAVAAWHQRPLPDDVRYLLLDGLSLRVKTPDGAARRVVLVAFGLRPNGRRALIDYRFVPQESQGTCHALPQRAMGQPPSLVENYTELFTLPKPERPPRLPRPLTPCAWRSYWTTTRCPANTSRQGPPLSLVRRSIEA
ncbi:MAG: transposase, partial [Anaerolineales bacterium]